MMCRSEGLYFGRGEAIDEWYVDGTPTAWTLPLIPDR
jgi:hypothetical protein